MQSVEILKSHIPALGEAGGADPEEPQVRVFEKDGKARVCAYWDRLSNPYGAWFVEVSNFRRPRTERGVDYCEVPLAEGVWAFWCELKRDGVELEMSYKCAQEMLD